MVPPHSTYVLTHHHQRRRRRRRVPMVGWGGVHDGVQGGGGGGRFVPVVGCVKWAVQYALVAHKSKLRFGNCSNLLVTSAELKQQ